MAHSLLTSVAATTTHRDRDELDRAVARLLMEFLDTHSVRLLRLITDGSVRRVEQRVRMDQQDAQPTPVTPNPDGDPPLLTDFPAWEECVLRSKVVADTTTDGRCTTVFPVSGEREVVGILVIETSAPLASRETDLVLGILGIVRNHLALLDYSEIDTLTGLLNRKTFEGYFDKLRRRMQAGASAESQAAASVPETAEPSWLALIDIDHFKSINDRYGHLFGDEILLLVSRLMRRSFRGADQLFRFGGEEFVVVLDQTNEPGAWVAFDRLRVAVEAYAFPQVSRVTISIGYTRIKPHEVPAMCLERADAALYYAKSHGRNRVYNCEALAAAGELPAKFQHGGDVELF
jgi:diguanylate cyclase (GGDEF)-like protein